MNKEVMVGYAKIENLYKDIRILDFKECYAMEKVHGTSAHVAYKDGKIRFFSGGAKYETFVKIFDVDALTKAFEALGHIDVVVYGEAYGGKMQGMSHTYGKLLQFIAFEVKIENTWLNVPNAEDVSDKLGLEFVPYKKGPATIDWLNGQMYRSSDIAIRIGIGCTIKDNVTFLEEERLREGIVIRPLNEYRDNRGNRVIIKHKHPKFKETRTQREVDPEKLKILEDVREVADEWVTPMRLIHVLDKLPECTEMEDVPTVIKAMINDVKLESVGEVVWSKVVEKAIGKTTVMLYKKHISLI